MVTAEFGGINSFLVGMSDILLTSGVERKVRGQECFELPEPVLIKISNPTARLVTLPQRNWNLTLPYAESLWIALGRNDMDLMGHYVKKLYDFSDDSKYMRAGYGPRIRGFNGVGNDYTNDGLKQNNFPPKQVNTVDQLKYIEEIFIKDSKTRQGIISVGDPVKDEFDLSGNLKQTKDFPCTRSIQFIQSHEGKLDMIVHMRSNDFMWGASAVNIFNFTFMQEYMSAVTGLEIGNYYHIVNNFHFYARHKKIVENLARIKSVPNEEPFVYDKQYSNLDEFDSLLKSLEKYEKDLRNNIIVKPKFEDNFFADWANVLYSFRTKSGSFINPELSKIVNSKY